VEQVPTYFPFPNQFDINAMMAGNPLDCASDENYSKINLYLAGS